jgi:hypothetical protein
MFTQMFRPFLLALLVSGVTLAHDGLDLPPPINDSEAWNALQLCAANVDKLVAEEQWSEIPIQLAIMGQSARYFREKTQGEVAEKWTELETLGVVAIRAAIEKDGKQTKHHYQQYRVQLGELEKLSDPKLVHAAIFSCPMCRGVRELDPKKECFKCGMALVPRVVPASSVYNTPGEPSVVITPNLEAPLKVGQPARATIQLRRKKDGRPVTPDDLLVVHTERIHLLIVDETLTDYHHEHPAPVEPAGTYNFSFTPRKPGKYRVFADIVPRESNVQEYAVCDLPATVETGGPLDKQGSSTASGAGRLRFQLTWHTGGLPIRAKQPVNATITVSDENGKLFTQLEPVMGTYSHLVAFHEDHQTVLHIHPVGAEPQKPEDRGGPKFSVRFWAPKPGFYRLYVQVQMDGRQWFAPFALNVDP